MATQLTVPGQHDQYSTFVLSASCNYTDVSRLQLVLVSEYGIDLIQPALSNNDKPQQIHLSDTATNDLVDLWLARQGKMAVECNTDKPAVDMDTCHCDECRAARIANVIHDPLFHHS